MRAKLIGGSRNNSEYEVPDDTLDLQFKWLVNTQEYMDKVKRLNATPNSDLERAIMDEFSEVTDTYKIAEFDVENNIQLFRAVE